MPPFHVPQRKFPVLVIAHRGASGECPENTLAAFQRAIELGADMLECDVQCSRDGTLVVLHDTRVDRTTDGYGLVHRLNWRDLRHLDAGTWFHPAFRGERLPTLDEVLELSAGKIALNIEIKRCRGGSAAALRLADKVGALVSQWQDTATVLISSFDARPLARLKACYPDIPTALLVMSRPRGGVRAAVQRLGVQALHISRHRTSPALLTEARAVRCPVHAFTVDDVRGMQRLIARGVDGLFTNYPERLQRLLADVFRAG
jgi:glycerophosphoryl diester phosphodiesterase